MKFSERIGAVRRVLQKDSMDEALKNALWNIVHGRYFVRYANTRQPIGYISEGKLLLELWIYHFHQPVDKFYTEFGSCLSQQIRPAYMGSDWSSVYDFIEFIANCEPVKDRSGPFMGACNKVLEEHVSAYRFVGTTLAPITSEEEILAVEQAMSHGQKFKAMTSHLQTALERFGDKHSPDYRNSIKESISAVEAVCQILTGDTNATLGKALKQIGVHPALEKGFSAIYGYTSDASGIRHALSDESSLTADDAKFFLVSCSAFINYLIAKGSAAGATTP